MAACEANGKMYREAFVDGGRLMFEVTAKRVVG